jgi:hypothetical protein
MFFDVHSDVFENVVVEVGGRPFELLQQRNLDDSPVPKGVPSQWPSELQSIWKKRIEAITKSKDLALIEDDHYKRRWLGRQGLFNHSARQNELEEACKSWLLDRLETTHYCNQPHNSLTKPAATTNSNKSPPSIEADLTSTLLHWWLNWLKWNLYHCCQL